MSKDYTIRVQTKLHKILKDPKIRPHLTRLIQRGANKGLAEYRKEIPVDTGTARASVRIIKDRQGVRITSIATNKGFRYPIAVHEGTGRFRGSQVDMASSGRQRRGRVSEEDKIRFAIMAKHGYKFSIRPNKFAWRAAKSTYKFIQKDIKRLRRKLTTE